MTIESEKAAVEAVGEAIERGFRERDVRSIADCYAAGATIYDLAPPLGHPFEASGVASWMNSWQGPIGVEKQDTTVLISGDLAICYGLAKTTAVTAETGEDAEWWQRLTVCLQKRDGVWKIIHEHASVPFHMDGSFRAAIDLTP